MSSKEVDKNYYFIALGHGFNQFFGEKAESLKLKYFDKTTAECFIPFSHIPPKKSEGDMAILLEGNFVDLSSDLKIPQEILFRFVKSTKRPEERTDSKNEKSNDDYGFEKYSQHDKYGNDSYGNYGGRRDDNYREQDRYRDQDRYRENDRYQERDQYDEHSYRGQDRYRDRYENDRYHDRRGKDRYHDSYNSRRDDYQDERPSKSFGLGNRNSNYATKPIAAPAYQNHTPVSRPKPVAQPKPRNGLLSASENPHLPTHQVIPPQNFNTSMNFPTFPVQSQNNAVTADPITAAIMTTLAGQAEDETKEEKILKTRRKSSEERKQEVQNETEQNYDYGYKPTSSANETIAKTVTDALAIKNQLLDNAFNQSENEKPAWNLLDTAEEAVKSPPPQPPNFSRNQNNEDEELGMKMLAMLNDNNTKNRTSVVFIINFCN